MGRPRIHNKHLPNRVYLKHGRYWFVDKDSRWRSLGKSLGEMYRNYSEIVEHYQPLQTMSDVFVRYEIEVLPEKVEKSQREQAVALKRLTAVFGHMNPVTIRPTDIYAYRDKRGKKSKFGANRDLELLSHSFTKAIEWGVVDRNPCRDVRHFREPKRRRYVTDQEFMAVWNLGSPTMQIAMDLAVLTGLRRRDLLRLTRSNLTDDGIIVQPSKTATTTGKVLVIEWSAELRTVVDRAKRIPPHVRQFLIATRQGKAYSPGGFSNNWQKLIKRALKRSVIDERFQFRDLRAKSASDDSLEAATARLGHASSQITESVYRRRPNKVKPLR